VDAGTVGGPPYRSGTPRSPPPRWRFRIGLFGIVCTLRASAAGIFSFLYEAVQFFWTILLV
jgi:hypothetical protein